MPTCDMCGKEQERLLKARIEGTVLDVCDRCAKFGEIIERPSFRTKNIPVGRPNAPAPRRREVLQVIVPDYSEKVRKAREKLGLTQEEFSKRLNEKESIMQKVESGQFTPSISMARKLEKQLHIELVETHDEKGEIPFAETQAKKKDSAFTLGDFIKKRKK